MMIGHDASFLLSFPCYYFLGGSQNKAPLQFPRHTATCQLVHVAGLRFYIGRTHTHTISVTVCLMSSCLFLSCLLSRLRLPWSLQTVSALQSSRSAVRSVAANKSHGLISPGLVSGMSPLMFSRPKHWTLMWLNYWGKLDPATEEAEGGDWANKEQQGTA